PKERKLALATDDEPPALKTRSRKAATVAEDDKPVVRKSGDGDEPESAGAAIPRPIFTLGVGGKVFSRSMSYVDNFSELPGYQLSRASAVTMDAVFYPFALTPSNAKSWSAGLGLTGGFSYAMGIGTQNADGQPGRTEVYGYEVGVRQRFIAG